jgi:Rieske Fe-S protein
VTQPKAGHFVGFDSLCTHEGCPVDIFGEPGKMSCGCHGAQFTLDTGKPTAGPAKKPMPKKPIIIEDGKIYKAKKAK